MTTKNDDTYAPVPKTVVQSTKEQEKQADKDNEMYSKSVSVSVSVSAPKTVSPKEVKVYQLGEGGEIDVPEAP
jgi:hypothetical protein